MKLPGRVTNTSLAAFLRNSGYPSIEEFATAVNACARRVLGVRLAYDHTSVRRWLAGSIPEHAEIVATVLAEAWGSAVPAAAIWPELRAGRPSPAPHLQPWVASRTLDELGFWIRCDVLCRREVLNSSFAPVSGSTLTDPIARWLAGEPVGLNGAGDDRPDRIDADDVARLERAIGYFAAFEATGGGSVVRDAAVGQLKYSVDVAGDAGYSDAVGNRLLAAVAELSGMVGWLCTDSAMPGPAQRYFLYGLQAARESTDPRAPMLVVSLLHDLARHERWNGQPETAIRLLELAVQELPTDRRRFGRVRAMLWSQHALASSSLGVSALPEIRRNLALAKDLHISAPADPDDRLRPGVDMSDAELASIAAASYLNIARTDRRLAADAESEILYALANPSDGYAKNEVFKQLRLASVRFVAGEPEQGCVDAGKALDMVAGVHGSDLVDIRLRELLADAEPYRSIPKVNELWARIPDLLE